MDYSTFDTHTQHTRLCSNNVYLICVIVHVQMWCVCSIYLLIKPKKIFECFICFWKWFCTLMFLVFVQHAFLCFFIKNWLKGCFARSSQLRASREICLREIKSHIFHTETLATTSWVFHDYPLLAKWFWG